jgi:NADPH-dependent 2,4-dienoyl-CoA reductase/sulfur reductase-like enzyme
MEITGKSQGKPRGQTVENKFKYVVVGGGLAGASSIEGICEHDRAGPIALFAREDRLPYHRPPLSKGLWSGKEKLEALPVHDEAFYASHGVQVHLDTDIIEIGPVTHQVLDAQGNRYTYEKLLIATGGAPRRLPFGRDVLRYYRTVEDYFSLRKEAERAKEFIMLGGGFIGSELAAALTMNDRKVTMIFPEETVLQKVLPADLSSFVAGYYRDRGVTIVGGDLPTGAQNFEGRTEVSTRSGKTFSADVGIAAVGLEPGVKLAKRAGLKVENGIVVNDRLQSSHQDIYAAGDVANFPSKSLEQNIRIEHWDNALSQGRHAGANMAGADRPFDYLPYFYSDLFDLGFEAVGNLDSRMKTFADWKEKFREGVVYYLADDRVRGVLLWNVWGQVDAAREIIATKRVSGSGKELKGALKSG